MFRLPKIILANNSMSICKQFVKLKTNLSKSNCQMEYIHETLRCDKMTSIDWSEFKDNVLCKSGVINENNINAVVLKTLITSQKLDSAKLFADYLKQNMKDLNLGSINGILRLYYVLGTQNRLTKEDKVFILNTYKYLTEKYKLLESITCDCMLHALCAIGEWKLALKVLEDTFETSVPTHSAFSTLIATLFKENEKVEALKIVNRSIENERPLQDQAYEEWIKYVFRKCKGKKTIIKDLDHINEHLKDNFITISEEISKIMEHCYESLKWKVNVARISKNNGQCSNCNKQLDSLSLSKEEFNLLQNNVKDKLIVGSDLFLKTSPRELNNFQTFIKQFAPFDIVLDALNIVYAARSVSVHKRVQFLNYVADFFLERNNNVLILGRKHMLDWSRYKMKELLKKTNYFFIDDLSQDDPYLITAAILSGPNTGIVSKDILRGHKFKLADIQLQQIFQRWQWENQWMVFCGRQGGIAIKKPIHFTPCAQKIGDVWHIPFKKENPNIIIKHNDGLPDLNNWLCIQPPLIKVVKI